MGRHSDAQVILADAIEAVMGRPATLNERIFAGAVALGESGYGMAAYTNKLTGQTKVLNNWGAVQCGSGPPCKEGCWEVTDYHVKDGVRTPFQWCYQDNTSMSRVDAAARFIQTLYHSRPKLVYAANNYPTDAEIAALLAGTSDNAVTAVQPLYDGKGTTVPLAEHYHVAWFSKVQRDSGYFELPLREHIGAQLRYHAAIKAETGEDISEEGGQGPAPKVPPSPQPSPPLVQSYYLALHSAPSEDDIAEMHKGQQDNSNVRLVQMRLKEKGLYSGQLDGDYGPLTDAAIRKFLS